jgi:hypothetical protein
MDGWGGGRGRGLERLPTRDKIYQKKKSFAIFGSIGAEIGTVCQAEVLYVKIVKGRRDCAESCSLP